MNKPLLTASSLLFAFGIAVTPAMASPRWTDIGKVDLPTYGTGELYIGSLETQPSGMVTGKLHEVLDQLWEEPNATGEFRDVYLKFIADCRAGTVAYASTFPEGRSRMTFPVDQLRRPAPGSLDARLLTASCG